MADDLHRVAVAADEARAAREAADEAEANYRDVLRDVAAVPGASITAIAAAAGVSRKTIHKHLRAKV